jgi:ParB family chromosome partitioning protein
MERKKMTQADIAQAMSKGRSTIANALRLLDLPEDAQQLLFEDKITAGHARAILSIDNKEGREKLTNKLKDSNMSVREAESLARLFNINKSNTNKVKTVVPQSYKSVAKNLKDQLNTNVKVKSLNGKNKIEIEFKDEDDLERIFKQLSNS